MAKKETKGNMTVAEAGRKGGNTTKERHGEGYYEAIGKKGGQKVRELIQKGKNAEANSLKDEKSQKKSKA